MIQYIRQVCPLLRMSEVIHWWSLVYVSMTMHSVQEERNVHLRSQHNVFIFSNHVVFKFCLLCQYNIYIYIRIYMQYVIWFLDKSDYTIHFPSLLNLRVVGELVLIVSQDCTSERLVCNWSTDGLIHTKKNHVYFLQFHPCYFGVWQIQTLNYSLPFWCHTQECQLSTLLLGHVGPGSCCSHVWKGTNWHMVGKWSRFPTFSKQRNCWVRAATGRGKNPWFRWSLGHWAMFLPVGNRWRCPSFPVPFVHAWLGKKKGYGRCGCYGRLICEMMWNCQIWHTTICKLNQVYQVCSLHNWRWWSFYSIYSTNEWDWMGMAKKCANGGLEVWSLLWSCLLCGERLCENLINQILRQSMHICILCQVSYFETEWSGWLHCTTACASAKSMNPC